MTSNGLVSVAGVIIFATFSIYNGSVLWKTFLRKNSNHSWVPLFGGLAGVVAFLMIRNPLLHKVWWLPLLIDPGTALGMSYVIYCKLSKK